jgi:hypothetical protein
LIIKNYEEKDRIQRADKQDITRKEMEKVKEMETKALSEQIQLFIHQSKIINKTQSLQDEQKRMISVVEMENKKINKIILALEEKITGR